MRPAAGRKATVPRLAEVRPGRRYGLLKVVEEADPYIWRGRIARRRWVCECSCGGLSEVREDSLRQAHTRSCRCLRNELTRERQTRHGGRANESRTPEYGAWQRILKAGEACRRWQAANGEGFRRFLDDVGERPSPRHRLVRPDPRRPFSPTNCGWETGVPRRGVPRRSIPVRGKELTLKEAAGRFGVDYDVLCKRLQRGWPVQRALAA